MMIGGHHAPHNTAQPTAACVVCTSQKSEMIPRERLVGVSMTGQRPYRTCGHDALLPTGNRKLTTPWPLGGRAGPQTATPRLAAAAAAAAPASTTTRTPSGEPAVKGEGTLSAVPLGAATSPAVDRGTVEVGLRPGGPRGRLEPCARAPAGRG